MGKIRPFEIALIAVFAISALVGLIYLANIKSDSNAEEQIYGTKVEIWGTLESADVNAALAPVSTADEQFGKTVSYRQFDERSFENDIVNAIAEGASPDLILISHDMLVTFRSKLMVIPFETIPQSTFRSSYIDGAEIFMLSDGSYAVPIGVDPLVLYYNRDLFANAGIASPPKTWEAIMNDAVPRLTKTDSRRNLEQSGLGIGEYMNVRNAKEILAMLFFQAGVTVAEEQGGTYLVTLGKTVQNGTPPAYAALNFYTQFASPSSNAFTWSRGQQFDRNAFTAGRLAMYIGFESERKGIENENPNLNFDVVRVPQPDGGTAQRNYGTFYGLAIPKSSKNIPGAYTAAMRIGGVDVAGDVARSLSITPVQRSLYGVNNDDLYGRVFEESALIARGWLDPSPKDTSGVFKRMIEDVTFGRSEAFGSVGEAITSLEELFK